MQLDIRTKDGQGFEFMKEVLKAIPQEIKDNDVIQDGLTASARVVSNEMRKNAKTAFNDKTGRLRKSIRARKGRPEYGDSALSSVGGKGARQAWLVEEGHKGPKPTKKARPFAFPAVQTTEQKRADAFIRSINRNWKVDVEKPAILRAKRRTRSSKRL